MADQVEGAANSAVNSVVENFSKLPASQTAPAGKHVPAAPRLFNREKSVHSLLGGGKCEILSVTPECVCGDVVIVF